MTRGDIQVVGFRPGQQDTAPEDGLPLGQWNKFQDLKTTEDGAKRRKGIYRIGRTGNDMQATNLVAASSQYFSVPIDTRLEAQMGTQFTIEWLVSPDSASTAPFLYRGVTTDSIRIDTSSSKLRVVLTDSGDTETTLTSSSNLPTSTVACQVVRDGADLTLRMDGVEEDTDTMSATNLLKTPVGEMRFGRDNGSNYFDGEIDYFRILATARANHNDGRLRFPDPRAEYVLADYDFDITSNNYITDRSRYGNTGLAVNSPTNTTALAHQTVPVSLLEQYTNRAGEKRLFIVSGEQVYEGVI